MNLRATKEALKSRILSNIHVNSVYDSRYIPADIEPLYITVEVVTAYNGYYDMQLSIFDKIDADEQLFDQVQSNTLDVIKSIIKDLSDNNVISGISKTYTAQNNALLIGWQSDLIKIADVTVC